MAINPDYFRYLHFFNNTVTLKTLLNSDERNLIALRHDVDYDLDFALELSFWENQNGIQSTYYLLHTAPYWQDVRFIDKCLQIQDFGHEVGLHLNLITDWFLGNVKDAQDHLKSLLTPLRAAGLEITGISTHGDRLCYKHGFINHWCFSDLQEFYVQGKKKYSAEGIPVVDSNFQISLPEGKAITSPDNRIFQLWSFAMEDVGLKYDAIHLPYDNYYTDSGGRWKRSPDPLGENLKKGRHQISMHPIYWRGEQKVYFFLSTARSGSKWLSKFLESATSVDAKHEFCLNHRYTNGSLYFEKRTSHGLTDLIQKSDQVKEMLAEIHNWVQSRSRDYAEVNVYLEQFVDVLKQIFPEAKLIHLHRDPKDVVRSILNRDWYSTPQDTQHPPINIKDWNNLSQFEKCCWYVRQTNLNLMKACDKRINFESMVSDLDYLYDHLRSLGIAVYPRLVNYIFKIKSNDNHYQNIPIYTYWSPLHKYIFNKICLSVSIDLGYEQVNSPSSLTNYIIECVYPALMRDIIRTLQFFMWTVKTKFIKQNIINTNFNKKSRLVLGSTCTLSFSNDYLLITPTNEVHSHVILGAKNWYKLTHFEGWRVSFGFYYLGNIQVTNIDTGEIRLFALMYDGDDNLSFKRFLGSLKPGDESIDFSFSYRININKVAIALYFPSSRSPRTFCLQHFNLKQIPLNSFLSSI